MPLTMEKLRKIKKSVKKLKNMKKIICKICGRCSILKWVTKFHLFGYGRIQ